MSDLKIAMKPVKKKSLYLKISDAIYSYIQLNGLKPGDKLPSEREMSSMLETSRNSVREGLRILEDRGMIEVRTGVGAFVRDTHGDKNTINIKLKDCSINELLEVQEILDIQAVRNAIERGTKEEKEKLVSIAQEMVKLSKDKLYSHVIDNDFHELLYDCGRNNAIHQLIIKIREDRFVTQEHLESGNDTVWLATVPQHYELAESIKYGDINRALALIKEINEYGFQFIKK